MLLTGDIPFKDHFTGASRLEVAQTTGLGQLEAGFQRYNTGERAADFVRRLLVLNETERMDVKQALSHDWFSNPKNRMTMIAASAIAAWAAILRPVGQQPQAPLIKHTVPLCSLLLPSCSSFQ